MSEPVIIEAAINGGVSKARNLNVPVTPDEIATQAIEALDAGAAIVHTHIEDIRGVTGFAAVARYMEAYDPVLAARPDAILWGTVSMGTELETRFGHYRELAAAGMRMAACDPGSVNVGTQGKDGLPSRSFVYSTSYSDIAWLMNLLGTSKLGPAFGIYEPGWLRIVLAYEKAGKLPPGAFVKLYFGGRYNYIDGRRGEITFGLPPTLKALDVYLEMMESSRLPWAVAAIGDCVIDTGLARAAIERGGHVRVGLEDFGGERQPTNLELIGEVTSLARSLGRSVATPADAARILGLER